MVRIIIGVPILAATLSRAMYTSPRPTGAHHKLPARTIKPPELKTSTHATTVAGALPKTRKRPARSAERKESEAHSLLVRLQISECSPSSPSSRRA